MIRLIETGDRKLMHWLNHWDAPRWIRLWMVLSTRAGDGWLWAFIGVIALVLGGERGVTAVESALAAGVVGQLLVRVLKTLTGRERPCAVEVHCWAKLLPPDRFSFPSGHTITAFCAVIPVGLYYRETLPVLLFCALSVAVSRIVLGLHYLSDVVAGTFIGCGLGYAAFVLGGGVL